MLWPLEWKIWYSEFECTSGFMLYEDLLKLELGLKFFPVQVPLSDMFPSLQITCMYGEKVWPFLVKRGARSPPNTKEVVLHGWNSFFFEDRFKAFWVCRFL